MSEDADPDLYRLEGETNQTGGLIIRKKVSDHTFKKPQASILGLDKLAERKRRENSQEPNSVRSSPSPSTSRSPDHISDPKERKYRLHEEETPTHTGGVNSEARQRLEDRLSRQRIDAQDRQYRERRRKDRERDKDRSRSRDSVRQSPLRFKDEPQTPKFRSKDSTSRSNWDDDDDFEPRKSTWDHPTPKLYGSKDPKDSIRSEWTPSYKFNSWNKERKASGATPMTDGEEKELWEEEQKRYTSSFDNFNERIFTSSISDWIVNGTPWTTERIVRLLTSQRSTRRRRKWRWKPRKRDECPLNRGKLIRTTSFGKGIGC